MSHRDDGIGLAVQNERVWIRRRGLVVVGRNEAAGDVDNRSQLRGCGVGCGRKREEGPERDADQRNAVGIDARMLGDVLDGLADGFEPQRDVHAVGEG
jgi:hypothetical protein